MKECWINVYANNWLGYEFKSREDAANPDNQLSEGPRYRLHVRLKERA